ncbi:hypothetical protein [Buchananella hordeovulneris]|uniref:Uncharacterized protein n=1 Tax=Buchananella hordeovulneris TaxID=52770 RepID=A0A1Q5PVU3_9ACTO|nr:hypothetical protein [Buchananella hordeovulneris]MDO5081735.1 hypothetical protein [Buchananella hordeovulneris]OKL51733.1 hypothetical protein BSZ40_06180 [Buchananella hordeovulneris]RRD45146.1 hypothetical protein EII13_03100 [Buchananella hordeovulneris]
MDETSVGTPLTSRTRIGLLLTLLALTGGVYLTLLLITTPALQGFAPGHQLADLSPTGLSHAETVSLYEALGVEGRDYYQHIQLPVDMVYPALFMTSFGLLLAALTRYLGLPRPARLISLIPVLAGLSDWGENVCTWLALRAYPEVSPTLPQLGSWFSLTKTVGVMLTFVLALSFGIWALVRRRRLTATR